MKREITTLVFVVLVASAFVAPVLGENPNKAPVAAEILTGVYDLSSIISWKSEGGIVHLDYAHVWGTLTIYINGVETYSNVPYDDVISGNYNPNTMVGNWKYDEVWTLPGGTLVGTAIVTSYGGSLLNYRELESKILLKGTGDFEGQILSMSHSYVKGIGHVVYEGYWLTP